MSSDHHIINHCCKTRYYLRAFWMLHQCYNNVLVAGRCISATHEAQASVRITATCTAMGEAAGNAAGICLKEELNPRDIPIRDLQELIKDNIEK